MKASRLLLVFCSLYSLFGATQLWAAPQDEAEADRKALVAYFKTRFPEVAFADHKNGIYAFNEDARQQAEEINIFPPYEFELEKGEKLFNKAFANGKTYADCIKEGVLRERSEYPYFDTERNMVVTLELSINECRAANGEKTIEVQKRQYCRFICSYGKTLRWKNYQYIHT